MLCFECGGTGTQIGLLRDSDSRVLPIQSRCFLCKGKGEIAKEHQQWLVDGIMSQDERVKKGYSVDVWANSKGVDVEDVIMFEKGWIKQPWADS